MVLLKKEFKERFRGPSGKDMLSQGMWGLVDSINRIYTGRPEKNPHIAVQDVIYRAATRAYEELKKEGATYKDNVRAESAIIGRALTALRGDEFSDVDGSTKNAAERHLNDRETILRGIRMSGFKKPIIPRKVR